MASKSTVDRIVALMKLQNKTAVQLAAELGIAKNSITEWKAGRSTPDRHISKLAEIFQVSTDYLHGKTNDPNPKYPRAEPHDDLRFAAMLDIDPVDLTPELTEHLSIIAKQMIDLGKKYKTDRER